MLEQITWDRIGFIFETETGNIVLLKLGIAYFEQKLFVN